MASEGNPEFQVTPPVPEAVVVPETSKQANEPSTSPSSPVPGEFLDKRERNHGLPDWYKVGWTSFSELPDPAFEEHVDALKQELNGSVDAVAERYSTARPDKPIEHTDMISQYLSEAYYGEWYHNAGAMIVAVAGTYLQTKLGGGLMGCLVIGAFLGTYYQTSIRRMRRNIRDDIHRELMQTNLMTDLESAEWINNFMSKFWLIYEPGLSAQIISTADSILVENTPSFLDSIRLSTFTLGTKAPRIEGIKTYPRTEPNVVCMDWKLSFVPNDVTDLTPRDLESKVNPKIVLTIRLGKGMIGAGMPILLEDIAFSGNMRLKFKFYNEFPHIKSIDASFLEPPHIDYVLKPVGGETFGFDINNIPGLESFIKDQIHATLGPMMYAPNVYTVDMTGNAVSLDDKNGVVAVTLYSASNLKATDFFGSLDPYVSLHLGNVHADPVALTKCIEDTSNPKWNETHYVLINNLNDSVFMQVMDRNSGRKDAVVGVTNVELKQLEEERSLEGLNLVVMRNGKPVGDIKADVRYFAVPKPEKKEDGTLIPLPESNTGILRFSLLECRELGGNKRRSGFGLIKSDMDAYAVVQMNGVEKMRTKVFKHSPNPTWNKYVDVFVQDVNAMDISITIWNSNEFSDDSVVARWSSSLKELRDQIENDKQDWWNLQDGSGRIHLATTWKPVPMGAININASFKNAPPIGVVRIKMNSGRDLKNVEALTGGKSDPYARVLSGLMVRAQTDPLLDNLDPVWNTALYVPVHSVREDLTLEVMDYNDIQKDKSLGLTSLILKDIIDEQATEDGQPIYIGKEPLKRTVDLQNHERTKTRGVLSYEASFHPTLELAQEKEKEEQDKAADAEAEVQDAAVGSAPAAPSETPADAAADATGPAAAEQGPENGAPALPEKDIHGELIKYTADNKIDYIAYNHGILSVTIHHVKLAEREKACVEVMIDSNDAQYTTTPLKGVMLPFHETANAFVKEMDFSRLIVNVKKYDENEKERRLIGHINIPVLDIVRKIAQDGYDFQTGTSYDLLDCAGGAIQLGFKFSPIIHYKMDPAESLENQGNLTVTLVRASNLKAADRSGTSDPYVVFRLDEAKVHKSEPVKKTLNPVFKNEVFTVPVLNRTVSKLHAAVYDWDQIGSDTLLGESSIPIYSEDFESFVARQVDVPLTGGGSLVVRLLWQPQLLARKRTGTSLFSATTRMFTSAPGSAFGASKTIVGGGIGAGGKVLGAGIDVLESGFDRLNVFKKKEQAPVHGSLSGAATEPIMHRSSTSTVSLLSSPSASVGADDAASINTTSSGSTVQITLVEGRNLKAMDRGGTSDPYARVRIGNKVVYKTKHVKKTLTPVWNESFVAKVDSGKLDIKVKDKNTLTDVDIGDAVLDVSNVLQSGQPYDGWLKLSPADAGEIHVRVEAMRD
ncbi:C2 domain-containing protein [Gongronella butleri]|nr:C2 domain-containing protein [Gongronella butleri]